MVCFGRLKSEEQIQRKVVTHLVIFGPEINTFELFSESAQ